MSLLSEIIIKPGTSNIYGRLVLIAYLLTCALTLYSGVLLFIKILIISVFSIFIYFELRNGKKTGEIKEIQSIGNKWCILTDSQTSQSYTQANILISNPLFQLIEFRDFKRKKIIVLFQDQLTEAQLRLLQLKITQNENNIK